MVLDSSLPDLSHIGNKYRQKTKEQKIAKLKKKFEKPKKDRKYYFEIELSYRKAFRSVMNKYPYGISLNTARNEVKDTLWIWDLPTSKTGFMKAYYFFLSRKIIRRFEQDGKWYIKNA
jgi:hypothetical protein